MLQYKTNIPGSKKVGIMSGKHIIFLSAPCYFDTSGLYTFLEKNPDIGTSTSGQPDFECFLNNVPTCPQYIGKTFKS